MGADNAFGETNFNPGMSKSGRNAIYTDLEGVARQIRKKSRVEKLYDDFQKLSRIEQENFINKLKNNY